MGQVLSTRSEMVGPEVASELQQLQASTPPNPPEVVLQIIEQELGEPADKLYASFNPVAVASASIGQVHMASLHDGQDVVVKVQHADIVDDIKADLEILARLARLAEQYDESLRAFQPQATIAEFSRSLERELDYRTERASMERIGANFAGEPKVQLPAVFPDLCSNRVLTMEKFDGYSIAEAQRISDDGYDNKALLQTAANAFMDMVFRDRFYHADPHPGSIWVLPPGDVIGLLDCGMVGRIDRRTQEDVEALILALIIGDSEQLTEAVINLGSTPAGLDNRDLERDIEEFVADYLDHDENSAQKGGWLEALTAILRHHHILLPSNISQLIRLLIVLEGSAKTLDPEFALMPLLAQRKADFVASSFSLEKLMRMSMHSYRDWSRLLRVLPGSLTQMAESMRDGTRESRMEVNRLDAMVNRLGQSIVCASLFLGSSWILSADATPHVVFLGVCGMVASAGLGVQLVRAFGKSGGLQ